MPSQKKNKKKTTNKQTNKQTHVLPSYDRVLYKFNETPLLDKVPLRMNTQAKYHDCNTLKNYVQNISKNYKNMKNH